MCLCLHERLLWIIWNCTCNPRFLFPRCKVSCCWTISNASFRMKQNKAELWKQKVTVTSVAVTTTKFLLGMCNCTINSDVDTGDFSLVLRILHVCGHVHVRSLVSQGMDCFSCCIWKECFVNNNAFSLRIIGFLFCTNNWLDIVS